jgi:hypothetical protein
VLTTSGSSFRVARSHRVAVPYRRVR